MTIRLCVAVMAVVGTEAFRPLPHVRITAPSRVAGSSSDDDGLLTWQEGLARALSPFAPLAERQLMVQDLVGRREEVLQDIQTAVTGGTPEELLPPDSELKKAAVGAKAVQRQLLTDILPSVAAQAPGLPATMLQNGPDLVARATESASKLASPDTIKSVTDRLPELPSVVADEIANVFTSTPPGLETPDYTVLDKQEGFEIRQYEAFSVCSVSMDEKTSPEDPTAAGESFNALAGYLFGENDQNKVLKMTTPVAIDYAPDQPPTMSFVLPSEVTAETAPLPNSARVTLTELPGRQLVAAVEFPGFATDGEVERQLAALQPKLARAGYMQQDEKKYQILQYNPPYTLPFLRRNELVVALMGGEPEPGEEPPSKAAPAGESEESESELAMETNGVGASDEAASAPVEKEDEEDEEEDDGMPSD